MADVQYRKTPRASFLDYDTGEYFVTICTKGKKHYFGEITEGEMQLSHIGEFISKQLSNASEYNSEINVTLFIVMPNHIHAIVAICDTQNYYHDPCMVQRAPHSSCRDNPEEIRHVTILSRYINFLKGSVTKYARSMGSDFEWSPDTTTIKSADTKMPKILQVIFYAMWSAGMKTNIALDYHPNFA